MARWWFSLLLSLTACSTVSQTGSLVKVERFHDRCDEENEHATVVRDGELLRVHVQAVGTCRDGETRTFRTQRHNESWLLAGTVGTIVGAVIEVPLLIGLAYIGSKASAGSDLGNAAWLLLLPGIGVGTAVAAAIGKTSVPLVDGPDEQVVEIFGSATRRLPSQGTLVVEEAPVLEWKLDQGNASMPIETVWRYDLTRLLVHGIVLDFDEPSRRLIEPLGACRRALKGFILGSERSCAQERERRDDARACHDAGFGYADAVVARLTELGCN